MSDLLLAGSVAALVLSVILLLGCLAVLLRMLREQPKARRRPVTSSQVEEVTGRIYTICLMISLLVGTRGFSYFGGADAIIRYLLCGCSMGWLFSYLYELLASSPPNSSSTDSYSSPPTHRKERSASYPEQNYQSPHKHASQSLFTLQNRLLSLVANDRGAAQRLLAGEKVKHPKRSDDWLFEKVIHDLERDRH